MPLIYVAIGLVAGVLSGLFGIGGGVVIVPALVLLAKFPTKMATGTSLGALLLPVGILGAWTYYKSGDLDPKASLWLAAGLTVGVLIGALVVQHISDVHLRRFFAAFLAVIAVKMWVG